MKLKGKCKELFDEWYLINYANRTEVPIEIGFFATAELNKFYQLPESMQWGVYVDFFDSLDIEIVLFKDDGSKEYHWFIPKSIYEGYEETRQEARTKALEKAQEIINSK